VQSYEPWSKRGKREYPEYLAITLNEQWRKGTLGVLAGIPEPMPGCPSAPQEIRDAAGKEFLSTLRELVNQWIESGRLQLKQFGEQPWSRNVQWCSNDFPKPIAKTLLEFRDRNPPLVVLNGDGRFAIAPMGPVGHSSWGTMLSQSIDPQQHARDKAISQFTLLLETRCPQRLFRCDECGRYFVLAREPRKIIKLGTYCSRSECRKRASAKRMESTSKGRHSALERFAAEVWEKWTPNCGSREVWIAKQVNCRTSEIKVNSGKKSERKSPYKPITRRWVTEHMQRIEAEVSKRKSVAAKAGSGR
jgi:hypothetical protein